MKPITISTRFIPLRSCGPACLLLLTLAAAGSRLPVAAAAEDGAKVSFIRDVRPILARSCFACHGPDEEQRAAELRLDRESHAKADAEGHPLLVAGKPRQSELFRRITSSDDDERMPPADSDNQLTESDVALIQRWIREGAVWESHWAFTPPVRHPLPGVQLGAWTRNEIDYFVATRLEQQSLEPSPEADRYQLVRRLSFDLTGLPPTLEQVEAFVNAAAPDAYERLVDQLLHDPAYGERWARVWLDLARYADTQGYEKDRQRVIWRYRDWVIAALNQDMSFAQFTIEQLAGDLLDNPTSDQLLATAFHRNTLTNLEGGTDDEEFRVAAVKDRVDTTVQAWMGLTMGCGKCHSHKYDPITQKEYYQFYAFFNQTEDSDKANDHPVMPFPTAGQQRQQIELRARIAELESGASAPADRQTQQTQRQQQLADLKKQLAAVKPPHIPVMRELPKSKRRRTHVHVRGSFLDKGEEVQPVILSAFHPLPADAPRNRLGVARWLVATDNPLTARVLVNRFWAQFFGIGIIETEEDLGSQGLAPSHQQLLDWLAVELMRHDWSLKWLCKKIVMSATYRQSSRVRADLAEVDPFNRLLARGPRFRLEAEMVRDNALRVAGLLSRKMYGPSMMPPQPPGIWQSTYNKNRWTTSAGEDKYRRGLYTFLKRTSPYPSMIAFDATSREVCAIRRIRTNTPLQAFVTLNDPVYVEAAQGLARRVVKECEGDLATRVRYAYRLAVARPARRRELAALADLYESRLKYYRAHPDAARLMATDPLGPAPPGSDEAELAAWTTLSNVILNLDELLSKG